MNLFFLSFFPMFTGSFGLWVRAAAQGSRVRWTLIKVDGLRWSQMGPACLVREKQQRLVESRVNKHGKIGLRIFEISLDVCDSPSRIKA